jgi:hypothetical protein
VYWTNNDDGTVMAAPIDASSSPVMLASGQSLPKDIAVDATDVYWFDFGTATINKLPLAGGTPETVATGQYIETGLVVDATHVYWDNSIAGTVMRFTK